MGSLLFTPFYREKTTSSGSIIINTEPFRGLMRHLIVRAATPTTVFDVAISDNSSLDLLYREANVDELNEILEMPVLTPLTVKILNASRDELFKIYFTVQEKS